MSAVITVKVTCEGTPAKRCPLRAWKLIEADNVSHARRLLAEQGWTTGRATFDGKARHTDRCAWCSGNVKRPERPAAAMTAAELFGSNLPKRRKPVATGEGDTTVPPGDQVPPPAK